MYVLCFSPQNASTKAIPSCRSCRIGYLWLQHQQVQSNQDTASKNGHFLVCLCWWVSHNQNSCSSSSHNLMVWVSCWRHFPQSQVGIIHPTNQPMQRIDLTCRRPLPRISSSHSRTTWYILLIDRAKKTMGTAVAVALSIVLSIPF